MTLSKKDHREFSQAVRDNNLNHLAELLAENEGLAHARIRGDSTLLNECVFKDKQIVPMSDGDTRDTTALHYASFKGNVKLAEMLLDYGADVNAIGYENNHEQTTPLILAAWMGGIDMLRLLLGTGADPHAVSSNGVTALSTAQSHNYQDRVDLLKQYGALGE